MSSTPEINRNIKFSPYGKPISKSLLTPCRTLGLSRKRKTPCNLAKTPLNTSVTISNDFGSGAVTPLSNASPIKPLNNNTSVNTPITPLNSKTLVSKNESRKTTGNPEVKRPKRDIKGNKDKTVKKCLHQNFQNAMQEENIKANVQTSKEKHIPLLEQSNKTKFNKKNLRNVKVSLEKLSDEEIDTLEKNNSSDEESEEIVKVRKRQAVISSDEEDENFHASIEDNEVFQGFSSKNNMSELKNENLPKINCEKENIAKKDLESNFAERLSGQRICGSELVVLHEEKLKPKIKIMSSKENLPVANTKKDNNIKYDFEVLSGSSTKSEKQSFVAGEDEDFVNIKENKKKVTLTRKESCDTLKLKEYKKFKADNTKPNKSFHSSEKDSTTFQQTKSLTSIIDDEEDAFTSTPEREKNEKIILVQKLKDLENEVKAKRKKVEDLKQAEIYKMKHNVHELKILTDVWRTGCVSGLNELLNKLQMHGPIDMLTLLNNLKVPSNIVESCLKLNLRDKNNLELKNDSENFDILPN